MKVALYKDNLSTGRGADHLICAQAAGLAEFGHDVTLMTCPYNKDFTFKVADCVKVEFVERDRIRDCVSNFDVCIAAGSNEILDLTLGGMVKPPVKTATELLLAPCGFFKRKHFIRNRRIKRAFNLSNALVILCPSYERVIRKFAPAPRIVTIAEWPDVREPTDFELRGEMRRNVIIYPAAINKLKNQLLLIKAFGELALDFPDWELHIYGNANRAYGRKCEAIVKKRRLRGRVRFMPFTNNLPSVYAGAKIMAFPSLLEGFPLTIIEGMKFELPAVVVDALPGVGDMIEDGKNGIISKNSVAGYAEALRRLMSDNELRMEMGAYARNGCMRRYTKDIIIGAWDSLIRNLNK